MKISNLAPISFILFLYLLSFSYFSAAQQSSYINSYDYLNINRSAFVPVAGFNDTQTHYFTLLKHSFEVPKIMSYAKDTSFHWNGLKGTKQIYSKDSLLLFFLRPDDNLMRPCILLTHGNSAKYRSSWNEQMNFHAIDLAMRGFCVAYYENPASYESKDKFRFSSTRSAFYGGFQAAMAATVYVVTNAETLRVDTSSLIAGGLSFGAFCSLALATADSAVNFSNALFLSHGGYTSRALYNSATLKPVRNVFVIGGALPKDDTTATYNSLMGTFLDQRDNGLNMLFLHGWKDYLVQLDLTRFGVQGVDSTFFYTEGPTAIRNNIARQNLMINTRLVINCKGGHPFLSTVCDDNQPNCIQQYQWLYLSEPPYDITANNAYFTNRQHDTLLHYFVYMMTQVDEVDYLIADFLQPVTSGNASFLNKPSYFLQPASKYSYATPDGHYKYKDTDCDGNMLVTTVGQSIIAENSVNVYPNPAQDFIHIHSVEPVISAELYSQTGQLMRVALNNSSIYVGNLTEGTYWLVIQLKDTRRSFNVQVKHL